MLGSSSARNQGEENTLTEATKPIRVQCPLPLKRTAALVIEAGCSVEMRLLASRLQRRKYRESGLRLAPAIGPSGEEIILLAKYNGRACGTLTLSGGLSPLQAQEAYAEEIKSLREQGHSLIEITRLAIDVADDAGLVMAALFDHAWHLLHVGPIASAALIEVHPRHASFYQRRFGFASIAGPRQCQRVAAPGVLHMLSLPALCELPRPPAAPLVSQMRSATDCAIY